MYVDTYKKKGEKIKEIINAEYGNAYPLAQHTVCPLV